MARTFSGQRLREARRAAHLPQEQVARQIDRSVYSVRAYERDRVRPAADVLPKLADALGCPVDALYDAEVA